VVGGGGGLLCGGVICLDFCEGGGGGGCLWEVPTTTLGLGVLTMVVGGWGGFCDGQGKWAGFLVLL